VCHVSIHKENPQGERRKCKMFIGKEKKLLFTNFLHKLSTISSSFYHLLSQNSKVKL
jgi:hypothetical protein